VMGRSKKAIEVHFDRSPELEASLSASGKDEMVERMRALSEMADIHYIRQGEPRGLGHAVGMGRRHVGDEAFAVLLPDDLMVDDGELLRSMLDIHDRYGRSVMALLQVSDEEISSYGCAAGEEVHEGLIEVKTIVEKPSRGEAPSNLAVFGRYVFTPEIFDSLDGIEPGRGGELQLTDAISRLLEDQSVYGRLFAGGRHDIGQKLGFLRANVELALERPDLAANVAEMLREVMLKYNL